MTEHNGVTLRSVKWFDLAPWLNILRIFRLSISLRLLILGAGGLLMTLLGWWFFTWLFMGDPQSNHWWKDELVKSPNPLAAIDEPERDLPHVPFQPATRGDKQKSAQAEATDVSSSATQSGSETVGGEGDGVRRQVKITDPATWRTVDPFFAAWAQISRPVWRLFGQREMGPREVACMVFSALWALAVWAFFGGAISRIAAVQLASDERVGLGSAARYAASKWLSYFAAPLFPLFGILLIVVPLLVIGLLMRFGVGLFLVALIWPLLLVGGFIIALLLLGLVFGWPLMWATISAEGSDTFDALSRSYAYTFQRPLRYLFYAIVAAVLGLLGWLLVANFAAGIIWLTLWATSWGSGATVMDNVQGLKDLDTIGFGATAGASIIHFWAGCVKWLALGYLYGYFWTGSTAIYLLLRRDVDATEMDEVFLEADESEQNYGLPPLDNAAPASPASEVQPPEPATPVTANSAEAPKSPTP